MENETAILRRAYRLMLTARSMSDIYEENKQICSKYVHSTSRGHEAIQLAAAFGLTAHDYAALYYRDDSILLGLGLSPAELMCQLFAKAADPFSGGRLYYGHPSLKRAGLPIIPHQSSATGMQSIPATGMAHAIVYLEKQGLLNPAEKKVVLCSLGDGSVTEGEVAEALQMSVLKKLPIVYLVQDNGWGISARAAEMRAQDAYEFAAGFKGLHRLRVNGADFKASYHTMQEAFGYCRTQRQPVLVHARCPLLGHHTSGVRKEWYRGEDLEKQSQNDPLPWLEQELLKAGIPAETLTALQQEVQALVQEQYQQALAEPNPDPATYDQHVFAPTPVTLETGTRRPANAEKITMVDAALHAIEEILRRHPEALVYGQDVGRQLGGVFREAALLASKFGDDRVFNTPIQEAYIIGSTAGMAAVGAKPIVEIQFADYIWPGLNQLVEEIAKSCYLTQGKFPVQTLIRVPVGAYGGGGPYHSGSIESTLLTIKGIKIVYPATAADIKGLMKAAFLDPNPVIMLEHKGLYWSKLPGTEDAKTLEPAEDYILPLGKARVALTAEATKVKTGDSLVIITYGMGVYWAKAAARQYPGQIEIIDLRTLFPLDYGLLQQSVEKHGKALILTEEPTTNSFAEALAGRLTQSCFPLLDAPIRVLGAADLPAVPLNIELENMMLPNPEKVAVALGNLLAY